MYKFYGQNLQDKFIFERYFKDKKNGISIECGSFDGVSESSTKFFEDDFGWSTINLEAYPEVFGRLKINRPNSVNISIGLSDKKETKTFNHAIHPVHGKDFGNGSLSHVNEHITDLKNQNCVFESYEINCDTYTNVIDSVMMSNFKDSVIDLFVLDVEGYELNVIEGMKESKFLPTIICVEYPFVGIEKLNLVLGELGYTFDVINYNNAFYIKNDTNI